MKKVKEILLEMLPSLQESNGYLIVKNECKVINILELFSDIFQRDNFCEKIETDIENDLFSIDLLDNTYNHSTNLSNDIHFSVFKLSELYDEFEEDEEENSYIALKIHRSGDIRTNYTNMRIFKINLDSDDNIFNYFFLDENGEMENIPY